MDQTLGPGWEQIRFHFFGSQYLRRLALSSRDLRIIHGKPEIADVCGGIVPKPFRSAGKMVAGVLDREYRMVEPSVRRGGVAQGDDNEPRADIIDKATSDGRAAHYLGYGAIHFGHFLLETLSRAWAWSEREGDAIPILQSSPGPFAKPFYALIPGLAERIEIINRPTRFRSVRIAAPAFLIGRSAHTEFKSLCARMAERALTAAGTRTGQPVYLSRRGLGPGAHRFIVGEDRLEAFLETEGFAIVYPESLSVQEQIAIYNRHEWIVSPMGSACHTRLFACGSTNLLMLARTNFTSNFLLCDRLSDGVAHYANVLTVPSYAPACELDIPPPVMLDEDKVLLLLQELGLVGPQAMFKGKPPGAESYHAAWRNWLSAQNGRHSSINSRSAARLGRLDG